MSKITRETLRQMIAEEIARANKPEPKTVQVTSEQLRSIIMQEVRRLDEQQTDPDAPMTVDVSDGAAPMSIVQAFKAAANDGSKLKDLAAKLKGVGVDEKELSRTMQKNAKANTTQQAAALIRTAFEGTRPAAKMARKKAKLSQKDKEVLNDLGRSYGVDL